MIRRAGGVDSMVVCMFVVGKSVGSDPLPDYAVDRFGTVYVLLAAGRSCVVVGPVLNNQQ